MASGTSCSTFSEADWVRNIRAAGGGSLGRGRRTEAVQLFMKLPEPERDPVLRAFLEQVPGGVRFFVPPTRTPSLSSASRYPVFRVVAG